MIPIRSISISPRRPTGELVKLNCVIVSAFLILKLMPCIGGFLKSSFKTFKDKQDRIVFRGKFLSIVLKTIVLKTNTTYHGIKYYYCVAYCNQ